MVHRTRNRQDAKKIYTLALTAFPLRETLTTTASSFPVKSRPQTNQEDARKSLKYVPMARLLDGTLTTIASSFLVKSRPTTNPTASHEDARKKLNFVLMALLSNVIRIMTVSSSLAKSRQEKRQMVIRRLATAQVLGRKRVENAKAQGTRGINVENVVARIRRKEIERAFDAVTKTRNIRNRNEKTIGSYH